MTTQTAAPITPEWTLADRLIKARKVAGLSQEQLAERLGIHLKTIQRYELGAPIKRATILGWAVACGVDARWLVLGDGGDDEEGDTLGVTLWELVPDVEQLAFDGLAMAA